MDAKILIGFIASGIGIVGSLVGIGALWGEVKQKLFKEIPATLGKIESSLTEKIKDLDKKTDERLDNHDDSIKELFESRHEQTNAITNLSVNITFFKEQLSDVKDNINHINSKLDAILQELSKKGV
jgi:peptidoglycan hydrolase CwlO-like protein